MVTGDTNGVPDIFVRDRLLNKNVKADLQITATQQPASIAKNAQGSFVYTVVNNGPTSVAAALIQHLYSNTTGQLLSVTPSQGKCWRYSLIGLCNLGSLAPGASATLTVELKALRNPMTQNLSLSSGGVADPVPTNNYLAISTTVTP